LDPCSDQGLDAPGSDVKLIANITVRVPLDELVWLPYMFGLP
jgi:hypothetical protein